MSVALSPRALDRVLTVLVGATVVAFAAGSSSVGDVKDVFLHARWFVLAALALVAALSAPSLRRLPALVLVAAAIFVELALVSAIWSVAPRLSAGRGLSVALLFAAALLLAAGASALRSRGHAILLGLLGGAATVALLGVLVLVVAYGTAVTDATIEAPPRFRGFGENPNTVPLLLTVALPIALAWALKATDRWARLAGIACSALFAATIVGAGSHGALLAAAVGAAATLLLSLQSTRARAIALAAVVAATVAGAALQTLPQESSTSPPASSAPEQTGRYVDVEQVYPLDEDVGRPLPGEGEPAVKRSIFGTSGRAEAWRGAAGEVRERPLLGFGFGTEAKAFVDRYYGFFGALPENSYLGIALQLGLAGLAALLALVAILAASTRRAREASVWAAACAGVVAAGLAAGVVQSYLYSVGNIAAATFWIAAFLIPGLAALEDR